MFETIKLPNHTGFKGFLVFTDWHIVGSKYLLYLTCIFFRIYIFTYVKIPNHCTVGFHTHNQFLLFVLHIFIWKSLYNEHKSLLYHEAHILIPSTIVSCKIVPKHMIL